MPPSPVLSVSCKSAGVGLFFSAVQLSIFEPFLGMRVGVWFTPKLNLLLRADCGGFGFVAYNNVDSVLEALLGYQVHKNIRIYGGYRGRYFSGSGGTKDIAVPSHDGPDRSRIPCSISATTLSAASTGSAANRMGRPTTI